jgi:hypothetical protein
MSFAFNAAPFSEIDNIDKSSIEKKKDAMRNKTIKKRDNMPSHVENMMQRLHSPQNNMPSDNDLHDFKPLQNPTSVGVQRKVDEENKNTEQREYSNQNKNQNREQLTAQQDDEPVSVENFNKMSADGYQSEYMQQYMPMYYNKMSENTSGNSELLRKLNYMIHLLEEQQDEKTGHVTEEVILYSFLGVFMIFIIDSFARAGKYVR